MSAQAILIDRVVFCSDSCIVAALDVDSVRDISDVKRIRVGEAMARVLVCYGCGLPLRDGSATS